MAVANDVCPIVGVGSVDKVDTISETTFIVRGPTSKVIVLRNVGSNLCPDTGATAVIVANGTVVAMGDITAVGNSIQVELLPGTRVHTVVRTFSYNNGIVCFVPGTLHYKVFECELERNADALDDGGALNLAGAAPPPAVGTASVVHPLHVATRDWYAWNDLQPPKPDVFHLIGEVLVPNIGVEPHLVYRVPQGFNPRILLINLVLVQTPFSGPAYPVWKAVIYRKVRVTYDQVQILYRNQLLVTVPVDNIQ